MTFSAMDSNFILSSFCIYLILNLLCVFMAFMETFQIAQFTRHFCNNITKSKECSKKQQNLLFRFPSANNNRPSKAKWANSPHSKCAIIARNQLRNTIYIIRSVLANTIDEFTLNNACVGIMTGFKRRVNYVACSTFLSLPRAGIEKINSSATFRIIQN
jgi:hypothetical protein